MTNMAAMPIYGKNLNKSSSPEPIDWWPWNFVCSIVHASTIKVVQIITLGWPWHILCQGQIWWHRLLYGKKWKKIFFGNFCSLRSQSCLKHSTQWVNEVEWVSVVKVILWPWSKVTQISKLNVWLLACILRWAIQGLLALLSRRAVVSHWRKYVHEELVNRLGGLSLPRKSVVRLTDRPGMTLDVYRGRKTTMQHLCQASSKYVYFPCCG